MRRRIFKFLAIIFAASALYCCVAFATFGTRHETLGRVMLGLGKVLWRVNEITIKIDGIETDDLDVFRTLFSNQLGYFIHFEHPTRPGHIAQLRLDPSQGIIGETANTGEFYTYKLLNIAMLQRDSAIPFIPFGLGIKSGYAFDEIKQDTEGRLTFMVKSNCDQCDWQLIPQGNWQIGLF